MAPISNEITDREQIISWCLSYSWPERIKDLYSIQEASIILMPELGFFFQKKGEKMGTYFKRYKNPK